ncbi:hypothetical protein GF318_04880 [Candidatus Micrarchaeota archaeon]|nr:hypothetical protein [Candidatus Micrarchaeota archaeon]
MQLDHIHLTVNAEISSGFKRLDREGARKFLDSVLREIGMKPLGPMSWAEAEDLDFPGQSFVQMISTSHISLHFFSETNEIYFDLYSCKSFDSEKVLRLLDETFGLRNWHGLKYTRANGQEPTVERIGNKELVLAKN